MQGAEKPTDLYQWENGEPSLANLAAMVEKEFPGMTVLVESIAKGDLYGANLELTRLLHPECCDLHWLRNPRRHSDHQALQRMRHAAAIEIRLEEALDCAGSANSTPASANGCKKTHLRLIGRQ